MSMHTITRLVVLTALLGLLTGTASAETYTELPDLIDQIKPAVVGVGTYDALRRPPNKLLGTGFAIGDGTIIATNAHVVPVDMTLGEHEKIVVFVGTGKNPKRREASRIAKDIIHDVVLLRINGKPLPTLKLGDSAAAREGMPVVFTGFPIGAVLGLYPVTHTGTISAITPVAIPARRGKELTAAQIKALRDPYTVFQLDATAYPGNSGSAVVHRKTGLVIGIVNSVFVKGTKETLLSDPSAITYAIPAKYIQALLAPVCCR